MASGLTGYSDLVRHAIQDDIVEQPCRRIRHTSHSRSIFRPAVIIDVLVAMDDQACTHITRQSIEPFKSIWMTGGCFVSYKDIAFFVFQPSNIRGKDRISM